MSEMDEYYRTGRYPGYVDDSVFNPEIILGFEVDDNYKNDQIFLGFTEHIIMSGVLKDEKSNLYWVESKVCIPEKLTVYFRGCDVNEIKQVRMFVIIRDKWDRIKRAVRVEVDRERLVVNYSEREEGTVFQTFYVSEHSKPYKIEKGEEITSVLLGTIELAKRIVSSRNLVRGSGSI